MKRVPPPSRPPPPRRQAPVRPVRIIPASQSVDLDSKVNDKLIAQLDTFLFTNSLTAAEKWRAFQLLILREYIMCDLIFDYLYPTEGEDKDKGFEEWLNHAEASVWTDGAETAALTEAQEGRLRVSAF
jgi:hypothetical protein